jgi:serine phosphatase RsbU (regulator of sigma subunit)
MKFFYALILNFVLINLCPALTDRDTLLLTYSDLDKNISISLEGKWKYQLGDNIEWSSPTFSDSAWEIISDVLQLNNDELRGNWKGVGWFRIHFKIDDKLKDESCRLIIWNAGKTKLYLDGEYITGESTWKNPKVVKFSSHSDHLIAVRLENDKIENFINAGVNPGFRINLANLETITAYTNSELQRLLTQQIFFTALTLAFGLLHLLLFLNYKSYKENLYYSLFLFAFAASLFMDYQVLLAVNADETLTYLRIHRGFMTLSNLLSLLFFYHVFNRKFNSVYWLLTIIVFGAGIAAVYAPSRHFSFLQITIILLYIEISRITYQALKRKIESTWLIALGFFILLIFSFYDLIVDLDIINQVAGIENGYPFGTIGLFICMSVYVAKGFAKANQKIAEQDKNAKEQEIQNRILEAENKRKTKELEDARKLQLSILPKTFPQFVNIDIAARMRTATEVGGDYYDYHISNDGTVTIIIGDATGHGTKAGIMTTLVKSLFDTMAHTFFIPDFFNHCTRIIKKMNFGNLFMALAIVKIKSYRLVSSSAGIPPILYYNSVKKEVEEIILKGMPVGAVNDFSYQQQTKDIKPGDTILLLTDGFLEMFNIKKEMFEIEQVKEAFLKTAEKTPDEILDNLFNIAESWQKDVIQEDDITFVVIKIK